MRYYDSDGTIRTNMVSLLLAEGTRTIRRKGREFKEDVEEGIKELRELRVHTDVVKGPPLPDDEFVKQVIYAARERMSLVVDIMTEGGDWEDDKDRSNKGKIMFNSKCIEVALEKDPILMKDNPELIERILAASNDYVTLGFPDSV